MAGVLEAVLQIWDDIKGFLCFFVTGRADYYDNLERNLRSLEQKLEELEQRKEQVEMRIRNEKKPSYKQTDEVTIWLNAVDGLQEEAKEIVNEAKEEFQNKAIRWFCPNTCLAYSRVGNGVSSVLTKVTEQIKEANFDAVVVRINPLDLATEMPMPKTAVGLEFMLDEVRPLIENPSAGIIGLYGIGGVGKTTLLNKIFYEISSQKKDSLVIWVDLPNQDPVKIVQQAICKRIEITEEEWKNKSVSDKMAIWSLLQKKQFFLFLDDIKADWLHLDLLEEAGVPTDGNGNGSKVIFTTRTEEICNRTRAIPVNVKPLPREAAFDLLAMHLRPRTLKANPQIKKLVDDVTRLCKGLPLLLITVGQAMAGKTSLQDWKKAINKLENNLSQFTNMENYVFPVLQVSYDALRDDLKKFFLYFSMFSEARNIKKQKLIELWIAEGFIHIDESNDEDQIIDLREKGDDIITSLKLAGLLEIGESEDFVKMHDVIHSMALWLACGHQQNKVLVGQKALDFAKWVDAKQISLFGCDVQITQIPSCNHLTTLILRAANLKTIPNGLVPSIPGLRVLDLSDNQNLADLPEDIGGFTNLHYLNLSRTSVKRLPAEVKSLRILIISGHLWIIAKGIISGMSSLQVFRMLYVHSEENEIRFLDEFEKLERINEIGIHLSSPNSAKKLQDSLKLRRCIKQLSIQLSNQNSSSFQQLTLRRMEHLERLELSHCPYLEEVKIEGRNQREFQGFVSKFTGREFFPDLAFVSLNNCKIKHLNWLVYAPYLQTLEVISCSEMDEAISDTCGEDVFASLTDLTFRYMPKLKSICSQILLFPSLKRLLVSDCPKLLRLPFDRDSAKYIEEIKGQRSWWNELQWMSQEIKGTFALKFQSIAIKQKIKIEMPIDCQKCKTKALRILASISGVEMVSIDAKRSLINVIGEGVDVVELVGLLRKKVRFAELVQVATDGEYPQGGLGGEL